VTGASRAQRSSAELDHPWRTTRTALCLCGMSNSARASTTVFTVTASLSTCVVMTAYPLLEKLANRAPPKPLIDLLALALIIQCFCKWSKLYSLAARAL
jgi:hypothetical protein